MRKLLVAAVLAAFAVLCIAPATWGKAYEPPQVMYYGDGIDIHHPDEDPIYRPGKQGPPAEWDWVPVVIDDHWVYVPRWTPKWLSSLFK